MKVPPKRSIMPTGKRIAAQGQRIRTAAERADAKRGATEEDVVPITPPSAQDAQPKPTLDAADELTPG